MVIVINLNIAIHTLSVYILITIVMFSLNIVFIKILCNTSFYFERNFMASFIILFVLGNIIGGVLYKFIPKLNENLRLQNNSKKELEIKNKEYSEDVLFLTNFPYNSELSSYYYSHELIKTPDTIENDLNHYKKLFINNIFHAQDMSDFSRSFHIGSKQIHNLFKSSSSYLGTTKNSFVLIQDLRNTLDYLFTLETDEESIQVINFIYYEFLFSLIKDLYLFRKKLPDESKQSKEIINLFREKKESDIILEVEKYLKICLEIKDKFKLKNLDNQFKSFSKINNKLSLINTLLEKTLSTPDSYDNLEIKVIANSIKKEVLPKIEKYDKENPSDKLSEDTLDKVLNILNSNNSEDKSNIHNELKIVNRYLDKLNKDKNYVL